MIQRWWPMGVLQSHLMRQTSTVRRTPRWLTVILLWLLLAFGLWAALILRPTGTTQVIEVGRPSPVTIRAPRSVEYESEVLTEAEREKAAESVIPVYANDYLLPVQQQRALSALLTTITAIRNDEALSPTEKAQRIAALPNTSEEFADVALTETLAQDIVSLSDSEWGTVRERTLTLYDQSLNRYEFELDEKAIQRLTDRTLLNWTSGLPEPQKTLVRFFTTSFLEVNSVLDEEKTEQRRQEARESVEPVWVQVQAGENIVREGEIVREETLEKLEATGTLPRRLGWIDIAGRGLLAGLLGLIFMLHLFLLQNRVAWQPRPLLVIVLAVVITALLARILLTLWPDHPYVFPMAVIALVLAIVFNAQIALVSVALLGVIVGMIANNSLALAVTMMMGSAVAIYSARNAERSLTFLLAGLAVAAITALSQIAFWLANIGSLQPNLQTLLYILLYSGVNGGLSALLSLGLFNLVGRAAGVVTPLQLMELAHPAQPLIRKLIHEAPGTYYHSVAVGNLAEAAAEAVGADALLLRVAAYYHDIGKTIRPYFFTDNQTGRENVHNDLDPRTSAEIIVDHVREGVKMAQAAHLPQPIIDFIATHHGTHVIQHFYQLALQQEDTVDVDDFRYPGPLPWTREQGILMLADSVEATVRSKAQNGKLLPKGASGNGRAQGGAQTLDGLVNSIIDDRLHAGQLDNTPLTLRDIVQIREAFITSLQGIYHPRVDYAPQLVKA